MKKTLKTLVLLVLPVVCFAQSNFKPGYVVTLKGDTLRGSVDMKEWFQNPRGMVFRATNGSTSTYTVANASAFGITGFDYYRKYTLNLSLDEVSTTKLSVGIDTANKVDTVFLRILTQGPHLTLYDYNDVIRRRYIISATDEPGARELTYHKFIDPDDNLHYIVRDNYKNELIAYALKYGKNSQGLIDRIRQTEYDNSLIKVVNAINSISGNAVMSKSKSAIRLYMGGGFNLLNLRYQGDIFLANNQRNDPRIAPELKVGLDFIGNRNTGKLIVRLAAGAYVANLNAYSSFNSFTSQGTIVSEQQLKFINFYLAPSVLYNFYNTPALKVFGECGLQINGTKYTQNTFKAYDDNGPRYLLFDKIDMQELWVQIPVKAGVTLHNKFQIYGCYYVPDMFTNNYLVFKGELNQLAVGFNYLFGIK